MVLSAAGWVDVTWDAGGSNSYRMGAEGKFDLALAPSHDPDKLRFTKTEQTATGMAKNRTVGSSVSDKVKVRSTLHGYRFTSNVLGLICFYLGDLHLRICYTCLKELVEISEDLQYSLSDHQY